MSILRQVFSRGLTQILPASLTIRPTTCAYHIFNKTQEYQQFPQHNLLLSVPQTYLNQTCGFKVKGQLRRRCKDCYFVMRQQRLFVICKTNPRHKQMSVVKDERNTWILSHATQSKVRPWWNEKCFSSVVVMFFFLL